MNEALEAVLGHAFGRPEMLQQALTHRSWAHEKGTPGDDGEAMEFLGDAVLALGVSLLLGERFGDAAVGSLSRARAWLVSEPSLAARARAIGLGDHVRLGRGEDQAGGRGKDSILADTYEAVLGAVYLDGGWDAAFALVRRHFGEEVSKLVLHDRRSQDHKTDLQEALQAVGLPVPVYRVASESGPAHRKTFVVELSVSGKVIAEGAGSSKKAAEQEAARDLLGRLDEVMPTLRKPPG
ncbi:MAG: ribonuclease III [Candidatus Polarisedimenticolia bacterium]